MINPSNTTHPNLVPPASSVPPHARDCNAGPGETSRHAGSREGSVNTPPPGGPPRAYPERVVQMLCAAIREYGLSDSAAAVKTGMSASTIAQWKREFPEIEVKLQQAREECRSQYLQIVMQAAQAENARGWRAAAWLLERLFPGDYASRADERSAHRALEERTRERESNEAFHASLRQQQAERDARFARANREHQESLAAHEARQAAAAAQPVEPGAPPVPPEAAMHASPESDVNNVKNSTAADAGRQSADARAARAYYERAMQNVKNSGEPQH
jgi:hypothetical protein